MEISIPGTPIVGPAYCVGCQMRITTPVAFIKLDGRIVGYLCGPNPRGGCRGKAEKLFPGMSLTDGDDIPIDQMTGLPTNAYSKQMVKPLRGRRRGR